MLRLCRPRIQLSVFSTTRVDPSRELLVEIGYALLIDLNPLHAMA